MDLKKLITRSKSQENFTVQYVDHEINCYNPSRDSIIIDERLKQYPEAHDWVLRHELKHRKNPTVIHDVILDLKSNIDFRTRNDETGKQLRRYKEHIEELDTFDNKMDNAIYDTALAFSNPIATTLAYYFNAVDKIINKLKELIYRES
ncbi:MAG: hypothetical protein V5A88_10135 [Candidatus Thermoplasmatota archaeon]